MISQANKTGRPSKLDAERAETFATALELGATMGNALRAAGIGRRTYYTWMRRGKSKLPADDAYRQFRHRVKKAMGTFERNALQQIHDAAKGGSWQASAWLLERRLPEKWSKLDRLRATVVAQQQRGPLVTPEAQQAWLADPELAEFLAERAARRLAPPDPLELAAERDAALCNRLAAERTGRMSPLGDIAASSSERGISAENDG